ncbi:DUF6597 domain-containing transcriptional factor [Phosphitispora sp. TUW77]|uniref:DUF6597 domain-containing transcriptional factor n=1 Tax=Phosphitispora sp. TUW77 TaxID=3152361 RepID=UPI003AB38113
MGTIQALKSYHPHQVQEESLSSFKNYIVPPTSPLFGLVFAYFEFNVCSLSELIYVPDGCPDLAFIYYSNRVECHIGGSRLNLFKVFFNAPDGCTVFGVRFAVGALRSICHAPMKELYNQIQTLDTLISNSKEIILAMEHASDFITRVSVCEKQLITRYSKACFKSQYLVNYCVKEIVNTGGMIKVKELADKTYYSARYINTLVEDYVGHSPKQLSMIVRFQQSFYDFYQNPKQTLSNLAWNYNFYDIAHLDRTYKSLVSVSSAHLFRMLIPGYFDYIPNTINDQWLSSWRVPPYQGHIAR